MNDLGGSIMQRFFSWGSGEAIPVCVFSLIADDSFEFGFCWILERLRMIVFKGRPLIMKAEDPAFPILLKAKLSKSL